MCREKKSCQPAFSVTFGINQKKLTNASLAALSRGAPIPLDRPAANSGTTTTASDVVVFSDRFARPKRPCARRKCVFSRRGRSRPASANTTAKRTQRSSDRRVAVGGRRQSTRCALRRALASNERHSMSPLHVLSANSAPLLEFAIDDPATATTVRRRHNVTTDHGFAQGAGHCTPPVYQVE